MNCWISRSPRDLESNSYRPREKDEELELSSRGSEFEQKLREMEVPRRQEVVIGCERERGRRVTMNGHCSVSLIIILVMVAVGEVVALPNLRGVAPHDQKYYQTAVIKCRDGSKSFPQERINDDFCDCVDGTDEPGTNACPEGKFYCKNLGHRPLSLFSSRINDGICDCCDGSDEFDGRTKCSNTCSESGKQSKEKLKKKLNTFREGSVIRKRDIDNAQKLRAEHELELIDLRGKEKTLKELVAKLKVEKEAIEKAEKQEEEEKKRREKEEQERRDKENARATAQPQEAEEVPSQVEIPPEILEEADSAPLTSETKELEDLSEEERGRIIASRWTGEDVSDIVTKGEGEPEHHDDIQDEDDESNFDEADLPRDDEHDEDDDDYNEPHFSPSDASTAFSTESVISEHSSWWSRLLIAPKAFLNVFRLNRRPVDKSEADRIRKDYEDYNADLKSVQSRISELESRTIQDFGKEGEFYAFYDNCFEFKEKKYVYKVCPYKDAAQVEGHSTTRLGRWVGFKEDHREMIFQNGDKCWNGPERSLRVKMRCGIKLELRSVDEPSRCEYVAEFSAPALCLESKAQEFEHQLFAQDPDFSSHDEL